MKKILLLLFLTTLLISCAKTQTCNYDDGVIYFKYNKKVFESKKKFKKECEAKGGVVK